MTTDSILSPRVSAQGDEITPVRTPWEPLRTYVRRGKIKPYNKSGSGAALTAPTLTGRWRSDVGTLHAKPEVYAALLDHAEQCETGWRNCVDCRLMRDIPTLGAIETAAVSRASVADWINAHPWVCIYCGDDRDALDHLVPKPWTGKVARAFVPTVPACTDCNSRLGAALLFTVTERAELVATKLRRKWARKLERPDLTGSEIDEFQGMLKQSVLADQAARGGVRRRLAVLDAGGAPSVPDWMLLALGGAA